MDGVNYLHINGIAHRDLKLENIYLSSDFTVKIGDFGFATGNKTSRKLSGTESYSSPEMNLRKEYNSQDEDMWQLGIILFYISFGFPPFAKAWFDNMHYQMLQTWEREEYWNYVEKHSNVTRSDGLKDLILQMLAHSKEDRISLQGIKRH